MSLIVWNVVLLICEKLQNSDQLKWSSPQQTFHTVSSVRVCWCECHDNQVKATEVCVSDWVIAGGLLPLPSFIKEMIVFSFFLFFSSWSHSIFPSVCLGLHHHCSHLHLDPFSCSLRLDKCCCVYKKQSNLVWVMNIFNICLIPLHTCHTYSFSVYISACGPSPHYRPHP